ncbi:MAG TPA: lipopolysaccharide heptosyltransferase II [Planctomycetaceae bacterium]|nr:lipopolysaccharide heptosyltransferase II [Planctomycetaceae bacterium]
MHIAIILPRWVGDLVMSTPMIRAVRQHVGNDAKLTAIAKPMFQELLAGTHWFDEFIAYDRHSKKREFGFRQAASALRSARPDIALLVPNSLSSAALAWWGGCRRRVGYARHGRRFLLTDPLSPLRRGWKVEVMSTAQHSMDLAEQIGVARQPLELELATLPDDEAILDSLMSSFFEGWTQNKTCPLFVFNDNAAYGPAKSWGGERFVSLARQLLHAYPDCRIVVHCGPGERDDARSIESALNDSRVRSLADVDKLPFGLSKALLRRASVVITTDSGPRHIAAAFQTPTVVLHGPMDPRLGMSDQKNLIELRKELPCSPCGQRTCPLEHHDCMVGLSVHDVARATGELMAMVSHKGEALPSNLENVE